MNPRPTDPYSTNSNPTMTFGAALDADDARWCADRFGIADGVRECDLDDVTDRGAGHQDGKTLRADVPPGHRAPVDHDDRWISEALAAAAVLLIFEDRCLECGRNEHVCLCLRGRVDRPRP